MEKARRTFSCVAGSCAKSIEVAKRALSREADRLMAQAATALDDDREGLQSSELWPRQLRQPRLSRFFSGSMSSASEGEVAGKGRQTIQTLIVGLPRPHGKCNARKGHCRTVRHGSATRNWRCQETLNRPSETGMPASDSFLESTEALVEL